MNKNKQRVHVNISWKNSHTTIIIVNEPEKMEKNKYSNDHNYEEYN